jgi:ferric-dicitrate binding protein FerR (iron transport regulator)
MMDAADARMIEYVASAARQGLGQVTEAELNEGWQRLASRLAREEDREPLIFLRRRFPWGRWAMAGAVAVALAMVAYRLPLRPLDSPLQYVVEGATVGPAETITATSSTRVLFSDESRLGIEPSSKIKVLGTDAHGAQVAVADGSIDVFVKPRKDSSWRFEAGPFSILVKGTAFRLGFDAAKGRLDLNMKTGVVEVRGPHRVSTLRGGDSLELLANPASEASSIAPAQVTAPLPPAPPLQTLPARPTPAKPLAHDSPGRLAMHDGAGHSASWSDLIAKGDFSAVVQDAERCGLDTTLARGSALDLITLADAARYTKEYETARQALLALRARFAGSNRAKDAAFFLGRLSEVGPAPSDAALTWYDTYLAEADRGPYAAEALGRKLTLLVHKDPEQAHKVAHSYLQRFPQGNQAELARSVVQAPGE